MRNMQLLWLQGLRWILVKFTVVEDGEKKKKNDGGWSGLNAF